MNKIIMFYGKECPHCHAMMKVVEKIEKEGKYEFKMVEVWHSRKNYERMEKFKDMLTQASGGMFGVPAFVDEKKKRALCGEQTYEEMKEWLNK